MNLASALIVARTGGVVSPENGKFRLFYGKYTGLQEVVSDDGISYQNPIEIEGFIKDENGIVEVVSLEYLQNYDSWVIV